MVNGKLISYLNYVLPNIPITIGNYKRLQRMKAAS